MVIAMAMAMGTTMTTDPLGRLRLLQLASPTLPIGAFTYSQGLEWAVENGWVGILVYGCIRDSEEIATIPVGLKALHTHPRKSWKKGEGDQGIPVTFAGVRFVPGHYLYADPDGVIVSATKLS